MINYPLSSDTWDENEVNAINRVVESNRYTMGKEVREFEEQFADFMGSKHAIMTNSGSSANLIAIAAMALHPKLHKPRHSGKRPNIIVPTVSWSTTYFPVHQWGFDLKFVDVDLLDFNISVNGVMNAIDDATVGVFAVNLLGSAARLEQLKAICDVKGIVLLEDNCESLGAKLADGRHTGTIGKMGTFSFFFSHHMQTMEGGMVLTDDDDLVDYLRSLRAHGWVRDMQFGSFETTGDPFTDSFNFVLPGYCVRPLEFSGATGKEQLKKWPSMLEQRRANALVAKEVLNTDKVRLQTEWGQSSWFGFGMTLTGSLEGRRSEVITKLTDLGVECRPIVAGNFMKNPVIELMNCITCDAPNADYIDTNGFFIGNDCVDLKNKIEAVAEVINNT